MTTRRDFLGGAGALALSARGLPASAQIDTLITKTIPSSGEPLPAIGLGTFRTFDVGGGA